jgi:hypothetical protein
MKFKVGDKVRVVRCSRHKNCEYNNTIGKIIDIDANIDFPYVLEDCDEIFREDELELVQERQFTKTDLKKGDKCTLKNGAVIFFGQECNYRFNNLDEQLRYACNDNASIVKVERPIHYETVFERKEEILDKTEKRYLASVIKPFRDKVKCIYKRQEWSNNKEFIHISLKEDTLDLPYFKKGTMYKGMEIDRNYKLEELNLK